ncbi:hypothetical protein ACIHEJ_40380 [Streptomyces sp. NPDC052301]|uniref:hypothetical protein n=1 Tax=Streptomyces sp. NPDC052301 TaxID=3365687 RepID=UPI0037CDB7EC
MAAQRATATAHSTGSTTQKKSDAGRGAPGRPRFVGALLILLSVIAAALCFIAFAEWLPSDRGRFRDYQAAQPCPAHATEQVRVEKDCLSTWRYTVVETVVKSGGKSSTYRATLKGGATLRRVADFGDPGPLLETLEPGDKVTGIIWRRTIMALSKDGVRQDTSEAPRDEIQMNAAFGLMAGLLAALTFVFGAVRLVRPRAPEPFTWDPYGRRMLITVVSVCFGTGLLTVWTGIPWPVVPAVTVPLVACVAGVMYRGLRRDAVSGT